MSKPLVDLAELNEAPASGDLFYIVDISDATDGNDGTNKKITAGNVRGGLATISSLDDLSDTVSGVSTALDSLSDDVTDHIADTETHGAEGAVVGTTNTQDLTNKRITDRVTEIAHTTSLTINGDTTDIARITALEDDVTINAPTGIPTHGQMILLEITDDDDAGGYTLTFNGIFTDPFEVGEPATTTAGKLLKLLYQWDSASSEWQLVDLREAG